MLFSVGVLKSATIRTSVSGNVILVSDGKREPRVGASIRTSVNGNVTLVSDGKREPCKHSVECQWKRHFSLKWQKEATVGAIIQ